MKESDLKRQIVDYLDRLPGAYFRVVQIGRIPGRNNQSKGIPDILGAYLGRAVSIEVKLPGGRLSVEQDSFFRDWTSRGGGVAILATDLESVIQALELVKGAR